jgi:dehydrodolichyl diphosphate syntase complex subunit NUS1
MVAARDIELYRRDAGRRLTTSEREKLVKPYLPAVSSQSPSRSTQPLKPKSTPVRTFLKTQLHILTFVIIHAIFSVYVRIRQTYHAVIDRVFAILYYHHRTPELIQKDVKGLSRLPEHLSVILKLEDEAKGGAGLEGLVDEVAEIAAWCACAGISTLSVYERTGAFVKHPRKCELSV